MSTFPWDLIFQQSVATLSNQNRIDAILAFFRQKKKILVLGASGVGKTKLMDSLNNRAQGSLVGYQPTRFTETRKLRFGSIPFYFFDTPGHRPYKVARRDTILSALRGNFSGIINVVSYGYHEGLGSTLSATDTAGVATEEYLNRRRKEEIDLLAEWVDLVTKDLFKWVITAVTKADLWWNISHEVSQYYENGDYASALGNFTSSVQHTVIPYCSIIESFFGIINPHIGETQKNKLQSSFLEQLLSACGKIK